MVSYLSVIHFLGIGDTSDQIKDIVSGVLQGTAGNDIEAIELGVVDEAIVATSHVQA